MVVDIGNSRIAYALAADGKLAGIDFFSTADQQSAAERLVEESRRHKCPVVIASVVPDAALFLRSQLTSELVNFQELTSGSQTLISGAYPSLGIDRISGLAAALKLFAGNEGAIMLDFGTATTLTAGDKNNRFRGGFITLGIGRTLKALSDYTGQLPDLADSLFHTGEVKLGKTTEDSIVHGTLIAHTGIVSQWIKTAKSLLPGKHVIIATGGYAKLIAPLVSEIDVVEPNLTLMGIDLIAEAAGALRDLA